MQARERQEGGTLVLEIDEARLEASNAPALRELLISRVEQGHSQIVLDLGRVTFMDSSALGALIGGLKRMGPLGTLALAETTGPVLQLLKLTRMDKVFAMHPTTAEAVAALEG